MSCFIKHLKETRITIPEVVDLNGITYYIIRVEIEDVNWTVRHRFKDFVELNEKLTTGRGFTKNSLPPKKVIGKRSPIFIQQRQQDLERYLQDVLVFFKFAMAREFIFFIELNKYDIVFLLHDLADQLCNHGDSILESCETYELTSMELYAISERIRMPCPDFENYEKNFDFSHVLDFCTQLKDLRIRPSDYSDVKQPLYGTSNINPLKLSFDLNAFKSLKSMTIEEFPIDNITAIDTLRLTLNTFKVFNTFTKRLNQIILCDDIYKSDETSCFKNWVNLREINFSYNAIISIDTSIKLAPNVEIITLNKNEIKSLENLRSLAHLHTLSLCENQIREFHNWHIELGNLVTLCLSQNEIQSLIGLRKLYSLVTLDVSCNMISDIEEIEHIAHLPCLEHLMLTGNPLAGTIDYRPRILSRFEERYSEICLDNERPSQLELDMAQVFAALRASSSPQKVSQQLNLLDISQR